MVILFLMWKTQERRKNWKKEVAKTTGVVVFNSGYVKMTHKQANL